MCRMIAAVGSFEPAALRLALMGMAANKNPAYVHERRPLGERFRHTDGWGAAWVQDGRLHTLRRTISILVDDWRERIDLLTTPLLLLHARRATSPGSVRTENTHPFPATFLGRDWAFCHNGSVEDTSALRTVPGMAPAGGTDSERLLHHFLAEMGGRAGMRPSAGSCSAEEALAATLAVPRKFTALHCLAASNDRIVVGACRHPRKSQPEYHALWLGEGPGRRVVSSEPVDGLDCAWTRISEPGVFTLELA